ncbi:MAG: ABC-F family ATP-binding cassette domain-containing protein [Treponema sp.]|jgi:ATP-binding cassette subfamily F protein 3|nr:ABC-F family ATP-binding cassette domain-containing protein [Treponema sp.]
MAFVQFSKVSLAFGDRDILKDVSLHLASGSRACLAGANGSGKSTLMKVLAGELPSDSGDRAVQRGTRIAYLPQSGIVHRGKSLRDEAETAFAHIQELIDQAEKIAARLQNAKGDDGEVKALLEDHHRLQEQIENSGYYRRSAAISSVLAGFGFSPDDLDRDTGEFSGGWQMRIALAKTLLEQPDILLLDEPTNYLDIEARAWLENWLTKFPGGCLLVSHDRYFLDVTINEVYEIFQGNLKRYAGNYSAYEKTRQQELAGLMKRYTEQQEEIAKTEALIRRFRYKATKAAFAQELIKRLEKMERIEIPETLKKINIVLPPPPHSPRVALTIEGLGKSYSAKKVLSGLDLTLDSGERLVVAGPNGAGKTTLLRILSGHDNDFEGSVKFGSGICAGYFSQDAAEALNGSEQVIEFMEANAPMPLIPKLRDMLGAFLFRGDDVYKPVSVLSGGEKSRLALLYMLLKPMNLLILDEPTNHLDLHSKDVLLETLMQFKGTIIFVSHDRAFMEALSTKTLELSPAESSAAGVATGVAAGASSRARLFYGNYAYYLEKIGTEAMNSEQGTVSSEQGADTNNQKSAMEHRAQNKQRQAEIRRLQRQEAELLNAIDELENEKSRLEAELSLPAVYSNGEKARAVKQKLDECTAALKAKTSEWETVAALLT